MKYWIPTLLLAMATMPIFTSCDRTSTEGTLTKNFTFGRHDTSQISPVDNVAAAGQNRDVGRININSDGESFQNLNVAQLLPVLANAFDASNGKGTGNNTILRDVDFDRDEYLRLTERGRQDSLLLVRKGFRVNPR